MYPSAPGPCWPVLSTAARMNPVKSEIDHVSPPLKILQCPHFTQSKSQSPPRTYSNATPFPLGSDGLLLLLTLFSFFPGCLPPGSISASIDALPPRGPTPAALLPTWPRDAGPHLLQLCPSCRHLSETCPGHPTQTASLPPANSYSSHSV